MPLAAPKPKRRSPIKTPPRRAAGTSLRVKMLDIFFYRALMPITAAITFGTAALIDWLRWLTAAPPMPFLFTVLAIPVIAWAAIRYRRATRDIDRLILALDGERSVADILADLAADGYRAFHDIEFPAARGGKFNVDHVLIGPAGIFAVETKTRSKRADSGLEAVVDYDGARILIDGHAPDRDPIAQARASADAIRKLIQDQTGRFLPIRPVLLFPGWFVREKSGAEVWVLEPKRLPTWLRTELRHVPAAMTEDQIAMCASAIQRYQTQLRLSEDQS